MALRIGIRREDKNRWERRTPLTPDHVRELSRKGIEFLVQSSANRVFQDEEFRAVGATVQDDLSSCRAVFGIKEMPVEAFQPYGVYMFFSHTIKGQSYNMPMLRRILDVGATLLDYERVTDEQGRRAIFFGNYAGTAGMFETLYALGKRLESEGMETVFAAVRRPLEYRSLEAAREALRDIGAEIAREGVPKSLVPFLP